jgi:hypothetical protein
MQTALMPEKKRKRKRVSYKRRKITGKKCKNSRTRTGKPVHKNSL